MHSEFDSGTFRSIEISECEPGQFFWHVTQHARDSRLNLIVKDPHNDSFGRGIANFGDGFEILRGFPSSETAVLAIPMEPLSIKLPNPIRTCPAVDAAGELVVSPEGAFIVLTGEDRHGFGEMRYLSLADWSLHDHVPNRSANFDVWQLVTKPTPERQSRVVVSKSV